MGQQQSSPTPPGTPVTHAPPTVEKWIYEGAEYTREEILSWAGWNETHIASLQKVPVGNVQAPAQNAGPSAASATTSHSNQQATVTPAHDLVTPGGNNPPPQLPGAGNNPPPPGAVEKWIYNNVAYTREEILSWDGWNESHIATLQKA
jgi:hypothetical protein